MTSIFKDQSAESRVGTRALLIGTDLRLLSGGIAAVLPAYQSCLQSVHSSVRFVATHRAGSLYGKLSTFLFAVLTVLYEACVHRKRLVVYAHAGEWPSLVRKCVLLLVAGLAGAKTILHCHAPQWEVYREVSAWKRACLRWGLRRADVVTALTNYHARQIAAVYGEKVVVVPNPLTEELLEFALVSRVQHECSTTDVKMKVITLCRLAEGKGAEYVPSVARHVGGNVEFVIGGTGPLGEVLAAQVQNDSSLRNIQFAGWLTGPEKWRRLATSDVFFLPTRADALCTGFVEAMCLGLPVVTIDHGGNAEVVEDGVTGYVVRADSSDLSQRLGAAVTSLACSSKRQRFGVAAREYALRRYHPDVVKGTLRSIAKRLES
ncbi:hypothetical protein DN412_09505 [Cupriavidus lacunae]|uniref:Glycosyltransferase family 1 protein n=2 Tax=Cupriavidus lacunae TaxID=2666307 RepID=A0A370NY24_9BURK|nr:hypothetical protein DN412_09505 [Cupriavidus lacunae]